MTAAGKQAAAPAPAIDAVAAASEVSSGVAAEHADAVDQAARFPAEAVQALRTHGLLGACAPVELGGLGCSMRTLVTVAETLARGCAATAMTWAMHQIQLACLVRHGHTGYLREYAERVCADQLLLASATSEVGVGGDIRTSRAALTPQGDRFVVEKAAATISYGAHADAILATLRRTPAAAANDQVLVALRAEDTTLDQLSRWDALGMRGTCSAGFQLRSTVSAAQVLADPFEQIARRTMVPFSHLLWSACWAGTAVAALGRARDLLRERARKSPGGDPAGAARLAHAYARLQLADSLIASAAEAIDRDPDVANEDWNTTLMLNSIKVSVSEIAIEVTRDALHICGFAGYQERGRFSVARHLRDVLSAPLMISNDRLLATNGGLLLSYKGDHRPW